MRSLAPRGTMRSAVIFGLKNEGGGVIGAESGAADMD
jgi:hypothetical protein